MTCAVCKRPVRRLERIAQYAPHRLHSDLYGLGPSPAGLEAWGAAGATWRNVVMMMVMVMMVM
eukprot:11280282-Karenia_brevis.AAC.1